MKKFFQFLINLQNAEPDTQYDVGNPTVKSENLSTRATVTN